MVGSHVCAELMSLHLKWISDEVGPRRHAILVLDNAGWHHANDLEVPRNITLHFLPPYSPELNPDEHVWGHVKTRVGKTAVKTKDGLKKAVDRALRSLQKLPDVVAGFFKDPSCRYAAA
mgnify:CR=1 FL=1